MTAFLEVLQGISNQAAVRSNDIRARPVQSQDAVIAVHADNLVHLWTADKGVILMAKDLCLLVSLYVERVFGNFPEFPLNICSIDMTIHSRISISMWHESSVLDYGSSSLYHRGTEIWTTGMISSGSS